LLIQLVLLRLFGVISSFQVVATLWPLVLINAFFMLPIYWLLYGLGRLVRPRRLQL
jgi:hypothetical protein